jgi:hypothetical protein
MSAVVELAVRVLKQASSVTVRVFAVANAVVVLHQTATVGSPGIVNWETVNGATFGPQQVPHPVVLLFGGLGLLGSGVKRMF